MARPRIFVGSSREGRRYADAIEYHLKQIADVNPWHRAFPVNHGYFEALLKALEENDFGVFLLTKDDELRTRSETLDISRDNVLFEFGLFLGRRGRSKTFAVFEEGVKIASDLVGVELLRFAAPANGVDPNSALLPACKTITEYLQHQRLPLRDHFQGFFGDGFLSSPYLAVFWDASLHVMSEARYCDLAFGNLPAEIKALNPLPKGVRHIIPLIEAQVLLDLVETFQHFGGRVGFEIDHYDEGKPLPAQGCLSVGLGFSSLTRRLGKMSGLYQVCFMKVDGRFTDTFHIIDGHQEIHPEEEIKRYHKVHPQKPLMEYGLVARILNEEADSLTPYLVCAGHTAAGTAAACRYICRHWWSLWRDHEAKLRDHHMACILYHKKDEPLTFTTPDRLYFRRVRSTRSGNQRRRGAGL